MLRYPGLLRRRTERSSSRLNGDPPQAARANGCLTKADIGRCRMRLSVFTSKICFPGAGRGPASGRWRRGRGLRRGSDGGHGITPSFGPVLQRTGMCPRLIPDRFAGDAVVVAVHLRVISGFPAIDRSGAGGANIVASAPMVAGLRRTSAEYPARDGGFPNGARDGAGAAGGHGYRSDTRDRAQQDRPREKCRNGKATVV